MVVPGSQPVARAGRGGGARRRLPRRRLRLALGRLLDVPGHEPRHPPARRALRLDLEPQLRGPPGPRRAHAPRLARRWPPPPPSRGTSSTSGSGRLMEPVKVDLRRRVRARPRGRRHRPDHPQAVPQAGRADRLRRVPLLRLEAKEDGWDLPPNPILATGPNFGCGSSREHAPWALEDYGFRAVVRRVVRRHLLLQLHEDRAAPGRAARGRGQGADGRRARPRSTSRRSRSASTAAPSRSSCTPRRAGACSRASTTSAIALQHDDEIAAYEAERERRVPPVPSTLAI